MKKFIHAKPPTWRADLCPSTR